MYPIRQTRPQSGRGAPKGSKRLGQFSKSRILNKQDTHLRKILGSIVYYFVEMRPGTVSIPVGLFADEEFEAPQVEVFAKRKVWWIDACQKDC